MTIPRVDGVMRTILIAFVFLTLTACGSGGGDSPTTTPPSVAPAPDLIMIAPVVTSFAGSTASIPGDMPVTISTRVVGTWDNTPFSVRIDTVRQRDGALVDTHYRYGSIGEVINLSLTTQALGWSLSGDTFISTAVCNPQGATTDDASNNTASVTFTISPDRIGNYVGQNAANGDAFAMSVTAGNALSFTMAFEHSGNMYSPPVTGSTTVMPDGSFTAQGHVVVISAINRIVVDLWRIVGSIDQNGNVTLTLTTVNDLYRPSVSATYAGHLGASG